MKVRPCLLPLFLILACLLAACGHATPNEATITIKEMAFQQSEITVKAGQPVTLRLVNQDGYAHAFDMDEFDIHVPLAANETLEITFAPQENGRYLFFCSSPGHHAAGMEGILVVAP